MAGLEKGEKAQSCSNSTQAQEKTDQDQPKREDDVNEITDIYTFHSTDKFDLEKKNIHHYFVASSQYYKMRTQKGSGVLGNFLGTYCSDQDDDNDLTITYIENGNLKRNFEQSKKDKEDNKEPYEEILLFHGTDEKNVDNIFTNNFDINHHPLRRNKV